MDEMGGLDAIGRPTIDSDVASVQVQTSVPQLRGLHAKLAQVMAAIHNVPKLGRNEYHKYDYAMEADIVKAVRGLLSERQIIIVPEAQKVERVGTLTTVRMCFTFCDGETGEQMTVSWYGTGDDPGDKGLYKAYTGALKYFLTKTFMIPTGDDPEADISTDSRTRDELPMARAGAKEAARGTDASPPPPASSPTPQAPPTRPQAPPGDRAKYGTLPDPGDWKDPALDTEETRDNWRKKAFGLMKAKGYDTMDKPAMMREVSRRIGKMIMVKSQLDTFDLVTLFVSLHTDSTTVGVSG